MKCSVLLLLSACTSHHYFHDGPDPLKVDSPPMFDAPPAIACPIGSTLVVDRTSCPADAPPAPLLGGDTGDIISMNGLGEGALPCLPALVCGFAGEQLVFSDDPETVASDGVLYADTVGPGFVRVYVYHVNGGASPRKFPIVLLDQGATDAHVTVRAKGVGSPDTDYLGEGAQVGLELLASHGLEDMVTVPANTRVLLDPALDNAHAVQDQLVHAIYDLDLDAPVKLSVVSVAATADAAAVTAGLSLLPNDGAHDRGTFPHATLLVPTAAPSGARHLRLGDGTTDPELAGIDATTGAAATLRGNYGVTYIIGAAGKLAISPRGGLWDGASDATAARLGPLGSTTDAIWVGAKNPITLLSGGGSSLPIDLLVLP